MSTALAVTDQNFEMEIEGHTGLAVVDFWAVWCGPCRIIAPILDALAVEYAGRAKVTKLDVDANIRTATRFNVRSIPMVLFFTDGKVVDQVVGAVPRPILEEKFKKHAVAPVAQTDVQTSPQADTQADGQKDVQQAGQNGTPPIVQKDTKKDAQGSPAA